MAYNGLFKSPQKSTDSKFSSKATSRRSKQNQSTPIRATMATEQPDLEAAIKSLNAKINTITKIQVPELYNEMLKLKAATERITQQNEEILFKLNEAKKRSQDSLFTNVYRKIGKRTCKEQSKSSEASSGNKSERGSGDQRPIASIQTTHVRVRSSQDQGPNDARGAYLPSKNPRLKTFEGEDSIPMRHAGGRYRIRRRSPLIHKMCLLLNRRKRSSRR